MNSLCRFCFRKEQAEPLTIKSLFSDLLSEVDPYFPGVGSMITFCSLAIHFAGCKCWARYSILPFWNLKMHVLVIASERHYSFTVLFVINSRILLSIEINTNCRFCRISWFEDET